MEQKKKEAGRKGKKSALPFFEEGERSKEKEGERPPGRDARGRFSASDQKKNASLSATLSPSPQDGHIFTPSATSKSVCKLAQHITATGSRKSGLGRCSDGEGRGRERGERSFRSSSVGSTEPIASAGLLAA